MWAVTSLVDARKTGERAAGRAANISMIVVLIPCVIAYAIFNVELARSELLEWMVSSLVCA